MYHPQSSFYCADVDSPTITMVTPGENFISLKWSPPSEGSPLSFTITWTASSVTSRALLPSTARNYTIRGLDSNTAYSGTVEVNALASNATDDWDNYTLPQGELLLQSCIFFWTIISLIAVAQFVLQGMHAGVTCLFHSSLTVHNALHSAVCVDAVEAHSCVDKTIIHPIPE